MGATLACCQRNSVSTIPLLPSCSARGCHSYGGEVALHRRQKGRPHGVWMAPAAISRTPVDDRTALGARPFGPIRFACRNGEDLRSIVSAAWHVMRASCRSDLISLPMVRTD